MDYQKSYLALYLSGLPPDFQPAVLLLYDEELIWVART